MVFGEIPKRLTGADCKSVVLWLRRFKSYSLHNNKLSKYEEITMKKFNIFVCACVLLVGVQSAFGSQLFTFTNALKQSSTYTDTMNVYFNGKLGFSQIPPNSIPHNVEWSRVQYQCNFITPCKGHITLKMGSQFPVFTVATFTLNMQYGVVDITTPRDDYIVAGSGSPSLFVEKNDN